MYSASTVSELARRANDKLIKLVYERPIELGLIRRAESEDFSYYQRHSGVMRLILSRMLVPAPWCSAGSSIIRIDLSKIPDRPPVFPQKLAQDITETFTEGHFYITDTIASLYVDDILNVLTRRRRDGWIRTWRIFQ